MDATCRMKMNVCGQHVTVWHETVYLGDIGADTSINTRTPHTHAHTNTHTDPHLLGAVLVALGEGGVGWCAGVGGELDGAVDHLPVEAVGVVLAFGAGVLHGQREALGGALRLHRGVVGPRRDGHWGGGEGPIRQPHLELSLSISISILA